VGKYNKINNFRIIGQGTKPLLCPINSVKLLIIKDLWKFLEIIHFTGGFKGAKPPEA
jgi:hypothetical protein